MGWIAVIILGLYSCALLYLFDSAYEKLGMGKVEHLYLGFQLVITFVTAFSYSLLAVIFLELKRFFSKQPLLLTAGKTFLLLIVSLINLSLTFVIYSRLHTNFFLLLLVQVISVVVVFIGLLYQNQKLRGAEKAEEEFSSGKEEKNEGGPSNRESLLKRGAILFLGFFAGLALLNVLYLFAYQPLELRKATVNWRKLFYKGEYRDFASGNPVESTIEINSYLLKLSREFGIDLAHDKRAEEAFERRLEEGLKEKKVTVVIIDHFADKDRKPYSCLLNKFFGLAVFFVPCVFTHGELVEKTLETSLKSFLPKGFRYQFVRKKAENLEEVCEELPEEYSRGLVLVNVSLGYDNRGVSNFEREYRFSYALKKLDESGISLFQAAGNLDRDWRFGDLELAKQVAFVLPNITTVGAKEYQVGEVVAPGRVKFRWPNGVELSVGGTSLSTPIALGAVLKEELKNKKKKIRNLK